MAAVKQVFCKSVLNHSGIADYCVNCYTGCLHGCVYCYARFMRRFSGHLEAWGKFLDIKINAPELLRKEVRRKPVGRVMMSSVCDGWQPCEKRYSLSRQCLGILLDAGFSVGILTKSKLVTRDFDILAAHNNCSVGCTLTTTDENLRFKLEPGASPTWERIKALEEAASKGIKISAFLGPFMPYLSDTDEALDSLIGAVAHLPLECVYADKLNPRSGVWNSVASFVSRYYPYLIDKYQQLFFDRECYISYSNDLRNRINMIARGYRLGAVLRAVF